MTVEQSAPRALSGRTNIILLLTGFLFGQGLLFLAQSYLVLLGQFELIVTFSLSFALAVFGTLVIECGGIVLLARRYVAVQDGASEDLVRYYTALVVVRLIVWVVVMAGVVAYVLLSEDPSRYFLIAAAVGLLAWCFSCAGVLDGASLSGFSGLAASIPFVCSAALLPFLVGLPIETASFRAGCAYGAGTVIAAVTQHTFLRASRIPLSLTRPSARLVWMTASESMRFQSAFLPGQFLFRGQLMLANALLPTQAAALFIYGKQASNAAQQVVGFARRSTFPTLIRRAGSRALFPAEVLRIQTSSLVLTLVFAVPMSLVGMAMFFPLPKDVQNVSFAFFLVAPTIVSSGIFSAFGQSLQATGQFTMLAVLTLLVTSIVLVGIYILEPLMGVHAFIWSEVAAHALATAIIVLLVHQRATGHPHRG